jgi:hypothetical protein
LHGQRRGGVVAAVVAVEVAVVAEAKAANQMPVRVECFQVPVRSHVTAKITRVRTETVDLNRSARKSTWA